MADSDIVIVMTSITRVGDIADEAKVDVRIPANANVQLAEAIVSEARRSLRLTVPARPLKTDVHVHGAPDPDAFRRVGADVMRKLNKRDFEPRTKRKL